MGSEEREAMAAQAVAVCGDGRRGRGMTVWDIETGDELLRIPSCAAAAHGLLCLSNHTLIASQHSSHGSSASGSIVMWPIAKPYSPLRSYTVEAIGPLCCTRDGAYLAAGAFSGNIYLWEVSRGRLLKSWSAHRKTVKCITFCDDGSFLISSSDDGMICVWSMIRLLDIEDSRSFSALLHCSSEHTCSVTGLLPITRCSSFTFVSSSLDGTWKVWDLISGNVKKARVYNHPITAIALHPTQNLLFSGSTDGSIFFDAVDNSILEDSSADEQDQDVALKGHNESITALNFCKRRLISASKDCTVCIWDIESREVIRRFIHQKGPVTNLVTLPRCALFCGLDNERGFDQNHISVFEKYSGPSQVAQDTMTCLPLNSCDQICLDNQRNASLDSQQEDYVVTTEMKVETAMGRRTWAINMARHVVEMNKHIQSCLLDMMELRLWHKEIESRPLTNKRKMKKTKKMMQKKDNERIDEEYPSHDQDFFFQK